MRPISNRFCIYVCFHNSGGQKVQLLPAVVFTEAVPAALRHHLIICPDKVFYEVFKKKKSLLRKAYRFNGLWHC